MKAQGAPSDWGLVRHAFPRHAELYFVHLRALLMHSKVQFSSWRRESVLFEHYFYAYICDFRAGAASALAPNQWHVERGTREHFSDAAALKAPNLSNALTKTLRLRSEAARNIAKATILRRVATETHGNAMLQVM